MLRHDGGIVPDPEGIITAGYDNQTARTVGVREGETLNTGRAAGDVRQIVADYRAGGWRTTRRNGGR